MTNRIHKDQLLEKTLLLAERIQSASLQKGEETSFKARLKVMFAFPRAKIFLIQMMDVSFRPKNQERVAAFVKKIFTQSQEASSTLFSWSERMLVAVFLKIGYLFPSLSIPLMLSKIRQDAAKVVFLKGSEAFNSHIQSRKQSGVKSNVNLIGESLLGEEEAISRMAQYKSLLNEPEVDYISIKISTIFSQINVLAFEETISLLSTRLAELYDEILRIKKQTGVAKFVNLDMEEYRDMSLTVGVFIKTLSLERFKSLKAGIVLQAYIPDSYLWLLKLKTWAQERVAQGGAPIKIRVVKGANLEMEKTESALHGWPLVTFDSKRESDANYKRMLLTLLKPESCQSIKVGIASHNVFDIAFAMVAVKEWGLQESVEFEMLEGMANPVVDILKEEGMNVLLYTPVVKPEQYISAIAYLVRRLDEGTADGNFLKEGFDLQPNTPKWESLKQEFMASVKMMEGLSDQPRRTQNRLTEKAEIQTGFANEPDTDWILPANREWLANIKATWEHNTSEVLPKVIPVVGVSERERETFALNCWQGLLTKTVVCPPTDHTHQKGLPGDRPWELGTLPWKYELAYEADYAEALQKGKTSSWFDLSHAERIAIIRKAALEIKKQRSDLIGVTVTEVGKLVTEIDPEISEAIDFANYYAHCMEQMLMQENVTLVAGNVNLVLPPWNFPVAIPAGGVLASLVTGNAVILKPSQNAIACSYVLCECLWKAGVPKDALFFLPAKEDVLQPFLKDANTFGAVILTGGTDTAKFLLKQTPNLPLFAETGGKNATIVTALSDREQAIAHVIQSAFGNVGQKCSATSLLILEKEVFEDESFKSSLIDAVQSLKVGSPWDFSSKIGPLSVLPNEKVQKAISDKTNWLVSPKLDGWYLSPSVKWGVKQGDFAYENELFAPILSVMCAENLKEAVELVNGTDYGLTSGLESLDEDEINYWKEHIQAGNLYINRATTGAIVQRQPFGGIKQSCFGFGMKAGGVNYLTQFVKVQPSNATEIKHDYAESFQKWFAQPYEEVKLRGQYNTKRYLLPEKVVLCFDETTEAKSMMLVVEACKVMKCGLEIFQVGGTGASVKMKEVPIRFKLVSSWDELLPLINFDRVSNSVKVVFRILTKEFPYSFRKAASEKAIHLYDKPVLPFGRYEFLNYLTEQSISHNYHRYGNLMGKE
jgi:RHH-type proline utilization regulon transcriptional repressor/proline dehydrogenase/delta 1-pyrroline-5-carboxylate dehydrogenase